MLARLFVLLMALSTLACVRPQGELIAFPPAGDPTPSQPSNTDTGEEPRGSATLRGRFSTTANVADVNRTVCSLQPSIVVDGRTRPVDVHVNGVTPCSQPLEGSVRANVLVTDEGDARKVVLELLAPEDTTEQQLGQLQQGLREVQRELVRRIASVEHAAPSLGPLEAPPPEAPKKRHYPSATVLMVAGVLGICTVVTAGVGGALVAGGAASNNSGEDIGLIVAGFGTLLFGAAPLGVASLTTLIVAGGLYAGEDHNP